MKKFLILAGSIGLLSNMSLAALTADMSAYHQQAGLTAAAQGDHLTVAWEGADKLPMRMQLGIADGVPTIESIEYQRGGNWTAMAHGLKPECSVVTGLRRAGAGLDEEHRWDTYRDAPLAIPGTRPKGMTNLPRKAEEIGHYTATFKSSGCAVRTDGARIEVTFPGVSMGIFAGDYRLTIYKGTNLIREEVVAKTDSPSVAYIYTGGLSGFSLDDFNDVEWHDPTGQNQKYNFSGAPDEQVVRLIARNRMAVAGGAHGSIAVFPPPHSFFFARELENNVGYVWHQKKDAKTFAIGVRQNENAEGYNRNWQLEVWSLYNAPPGTAQRMSAFYYLSPDDASKCRDQAMALTRDDHYKPIPGYKTMATHFHTAVTVELTTAGDLKKDAPWMQPVHDLGVNIVYLCDFHSDGHPNDPGPIRLKEQKDYYEIAKLHSNKDFYIIPGEEANAYFGGHYNVLFQKPTYFTHVRGEGVPLADNVDGYGKVYHLGSSADVFEMLKQEDAVVWQTHPRTKDSTGFPDLVKDFDFFKSDHFIGAGFKYLPADMSYKRLGEGRAFGALDDMNNWGNVKYLIGEVDSYKKFPDDDLYGDFNINYVKLDQMPAVGDYKPVLESLRHGDFFVTSGEVLIPKYSVKKTGANVDIDADVEWTFPPEFVEVVWSDGVKVDRQIISITDRATFSSEHFHVQLPAAGKKWIRFAAWDTAANGAFTQPVHLVN